MEIQNCGRVYRRLDYLLPCIYAWIMLPWCRQSIRIEKEFVTTMSESKSKTKLNHSTTHTYGKLPGLLPIYPLYPWFHNIRLGWKESSPYKALIPSLIWIHKLLDLDCLDDFRFEDIFRPLFLGIQLSRQIFTLDPSLMRQTIPCFRSSKPCSIPLQPGEASPLKMVSRRFPLG
jgi:hypothetical protein